jgi:hypothetical protein
MWEIIAAILGGTWIASKLPPHVDDVKPRFRIEFHRTWKCRDCEAEFDLREGIVPKQCPCCKKFDLY